MVKFQKQLEQQLVPEWRDAYCNYKLLKQQIKKIKQHHHQGLKSSTTVNVTALRLTLGQLHAENLEHGAGKQQHEVVKKMSGSPLAAFTAGLARRTSNAFVKLPIQVHQRQCDSHEGDIYETEILEPCISAAEHEKIFFKKLDEQFNMVDAFFRNKEAEYVIRARQLQSQMKILLEMQKALARHRVSHLSPCDSDDSSSTDELEIDFPSLPSAGKCDTKARNDHFFAVAATNASSNVGVLTVHENPEYDHQPLEHRHCKINIRGDDNKPCDASPYHFPGCNKPQIIVNNMKPMETLLALSRLLTAGHTKRRLPCALDDTSTDEVTTKISKRQVQSAEKMLRAAFTEFYRGLTLLSGFSSLNRLAFEKILKKYDKVTGRNISETYLRAIQTSDFAGSAEVVKLMDGVEGIFTEHFTKKNQRQAMAYLKPTIQKPSHSITFLSGLFCGCSFALFVAYIVMLKLPHACKFSEGTSYTAVFPIFSTLALLLLHLYLYGCNVYFWQKVRINYAFIFEFAPGTELRAREVLLVSTGLTTLLTLGMVVHLVFHSNRKTFNGDVIPLIVSLIFLAFLLFPFNLFYKSSRRAFLRCLMRVVLAPFYKVVFADFFVADQITSQGTAFRNLEYAACYYISGAFKAQRSAEDVAAVCTGSSKFMVFQYIVSMLPYWWRIMQCFRRWMDERDLAHVANIGKYLSALIAVVLRVAYIRSKNDATTDVYRTLFILASVTATLYQLYWDIVVDWGLLQRNSVNPWLRDQLILKRKYIYFISMILNSVLRLAWIYNLLNPRKDVLSHNLMDLTFAALEVIRRGHWNFYRLENEHLNNVGKYRAVKQVPLPFKHTVRHRS